MKRDAAYFRSIQNLKPIEEIVQEHVDYVLDQIESYIKDGGSDQQIIFYLVTPEKCLNMLFKKLTEDYGLTIRDKGETPEGRHTFIVSWEE